MLSVTVRFGQWVILHFVLLARADETAAVSAGLTSIGSGELAVDMYENEFAEETAESRFGFGAS